MFARMRRARTVVTCNKVKTLSDINESENCLSSDYMKRSMTSVVVLPTGPIRKRKQWK
jgi:hypothetical protein